MVDSRIVLIGLYVNDLIIFGHDMSDIREVKDSFTLKWNCFVSEAICLRRNMTYVMDMLSDFGITHYKPPSLPCVSDWYSQLNDSSVRLGTTETTEYRSMVGSMLAQCIISNWTRPDLSNVLAH
jgi:hypothetical protein